MVEDALSEEILMNNVRLGDKVIANAEDDKLKFIPAPEAIPQLTGAE